MEYEMKVQAPPALTVKPRTVRRPRGERSPFLLSLAPYYISAGRPVPAWAQKPRRRVTHDKRPRVPPGPATPSARQVPRECLRVTVSGKELLKQPSLQKGYKDSSATLSSCSQGRRHCRRRPHLGEEGASREFLGCKPRSY